MGQALDPCRSPQVENDSEVVPSTGTKGAKAPEDEYSFHGHWLTQSGYVQIIGVDRILWSSSDVEKVTFTTDKSGKRVCITSLAGRRYEGRMQPDGKLRWSDGDVWTRQLASHRGRQCGLGALLGIFGGSSGAEAAAGAEHHGAGQVPLLPLADIASAPPPRPPDVVMVNGRPDFSGAWTLADIQGDIDTFLADSGISWIKRSAAQALGYGKGAVRRCYQQSGDDVIIEVRGPVEYCLQFRIGAGEQRTASPEGEVLTTPTWQHDYVLHCKTRRLDGSPLTTQDTYYLDATTLIVAGRSVSGHSVVWIYKKDMG
eukprot:TRINITY_DN22301_c0_g1_i1.p1 TRINITY_DN22301_c0_g1~~TRINITY_DN22301_c0_g1_i1.p1  ORF type:complete len:314 (-),score=60.83 TRINITY_DN22301_c0_g1_i1:388-1329(-)